MKEKEKRRGRGRRWRNQDQASQGMELTLDMNSSMELWIFGMETNLDYEFYEIWHVSLVLYDDYFAQT